MSATFHNHDPSILRRRLFQAVRGVWTTGISEPELLKLALSRSKTQVCPFHVLFPDFRDSDYSWVASLEQSKEFNASEWRVVETAFLTSGSDRRRRDALVTALVTYKRVFKRNSNVSRVCCIEAYSLHPTTYLTADSSSEHTPIRHRTDQTAESVA